jgi:hypothetical protein
MISVTGRAEEGAPLMGAPGVVGCDVGDDFNSFGTDLQPGTKVQKKKQKEDCENASDNA